MIEESLKKRILACFPQPGTAKEEWEIAEAIIREVGEDLLVFMGEMPLADFRGFTNLQVPDVRRKILQHFLDVVK